MTFVKKQVELRVLKATEGMILTDGQNYSSIGGEVYLGVNDSPENWSEITESEYNEIVKEQENPEKRRHNQ